MGIGNFIKRAVNKIEDAGKRTRDQLSELDDDFKRVTRKASVHLRNAQPYIAGGVTFGLSWVPFVGPILSTSYAALETLIARQLGATAARAEGESGRDARRAGREHQQKVGIVAGAAALLGNVINLLIPAASTSPTASAMVSGATTGAGAGAGAAVPSSVGSAFLSGASAGAAGAVKVATEAGGGILGTLGSIGEAALGLAPVAQKFLQSGEIPKTGLGPLDDLLAAGEGFLGGGGSVGEVDPGTPEFVGPVGAGIPGWVKLAGVGAVVVGGVVVYRAVRRKAA